MSDIVSTLLEMGFSKERAELAISKTNATNVEEAMEWLFTHEEEASLNEAEPVSEPLAASSSTEVMELDSSTNAEEEPQVARSIKCDECLKLFKSQAEVEFHSAKSGHSQYSESTEEKKPLTEEEKKEQLAKIEAKLRQRRLEREARERQDELDREKNRIKSGKEMLEAKKKHEDQEIKKMVEQRKREKEEERMARQRVKDQIEQDKLRRKAKFGGGQETSSTTQPVAAPPTPPTVTPTATTQKNFTEVKLQIRLTNGSTLTQTFGAKEPLSAVKFYIEMNRTDGPGPFSLRTSFPKKVFNDEDFDKPLYLLDLAPSAVLIVSKTA